MVTLNKEQKKIIYHVKEGKNVIVDSVAGTGKTTVILSVAKNVKTKQILQITYNKSLKHEVREKIEKENINNIQVHTYHSLAYKYYSRSGHKDIEINRIIQDDKRLIKPIEEFDLLVIDEAQDMTYLYFQLIVKYVKDYGKPIQILILGDYMQGLYEFKGSDVRFLTLAKEIWVNSGILINNNFKLCTMKTSYRITNQMSKFINNVMIGSERMLADKEDMHVNYIRNTRYNIEKIVYYEISKLLTEGVKPNEIFVLGGSVKGENSNIRRLENMLVVNNIPCHVPMLENENIDERVTNGKVVFTTFHSVKGRERKYVFVVGFDNNYFRFYGRTLNREICPNTLYVACTRGSKGLYLLEYDNRPGDRPLEFLQLNHRDMKQEEDYIHFRGMHQTYFQKIDESEQLHQVRITATDLIKFVSISVIQEVTTILDKIIIVENEPEETIEIPSIIQTSGGYYEEVSDLNGIAITSMYYDYLKDIWDDNDKSILLELIEDKLEEIKGKKRDFLDKYIENLPEKVETIEDYLYMANVNLALQESLYFKLNQIGREEYGWLSEEVLLKCRERLRDVISGDSQNKQPIIEEDIMHMSWEEEHTKIDELLKEDFSEIFRFTGRVDLITETTLWELKCTSEISTDHILQLIIYAWLYQMRPGYDEESDKKIFKLFNIKTGELIRLDATIEELNTIIILLLKNRYQKNIIKTDEEFIQSCREYLLN
tara:strand:+ start:9032 stop:11170 length:2139 start_codon:yes stop_codon:yes gene_type:complete